TPHPKGGGRRTSGDDTSYLQMINGEIEFLPKPAEMIQPFARRFVALDSFFLVPRRDALHSFIKKILHLPEVEDQRQRANQPRQLFEVFEHSKIFWWRSQTLHELLHPAPYGVGRIAVADARVSGACFT